MTRPSVHRIRRIALFTFGMLLCTSQLEGGQEQKGLLTVKRIYSQPSLGGRLNRGVKWAPDGKAVSFFETKGEGVAAKSELWALDVASGQRRLLANAEKLETVLPAEKAPQSQATGLGRRAATRKASRLAVRVGARRPGDSIRRSESAGMARSENAGHPNARSW